MDISRATSYKSIILIVLILVSTSLFGRNTDLYRAFYIGK